MAAITKKRGGAISRWQLKFQANSATGAGCLATGFALPTPSPATFDTPGLGIDSPMSSELDISAIWRRHLQFSVEKM
jgi:hypothetical protein